MADANKGAWEKFLETRSQWAEQQPSLGAQLQAMVREGARDIRGTLHETYFGKQEHTPEMGAPGSPTPQMVTEDLGKAHLSYQEMIGAYATQGREAQERQNDLER